MSEINWYIKNREEKIIKTHKNIFKNKKINRKNICR